MKIKIHHVFVVWLFLAVPFSLLAAGHQEAYPRPIPMGVSISTTPSQPLIFAGTAGMRVQALQDPNFKFILSNNHVMGAVAPDLCPNTAPQGTWIIQPGSLDLGFDPGNDPDYVAGWVFRWVPIDFSFGARNYVDAAIAITSPALVSNKIKGIGPAGMDQAPTQALAFPTIGMSVKKSGRTTGVTTGVVQALNTTLNVNYGAECGTARFVAQVVTTGGLGASGDSGSVVLEENTNIPVGLYFAGSPFTGVMNYIYFVYLSLGVFVDGDVAPASARADTPQSHQAMMMNPEIERIKPVQARYEERLFAVPGVVGVGIGRMENGEPGLIVYVERDKERLSPRIGRALNGQDQTPGMSAKTAEGVPFRVIKSGTFTAH